MSVIINTLYNHSQKVYLSHDKDNTFPSTKHEEFPQSSVGISLKIPYLCFL